jgi:hypothetical protein
MIMSLQDLYSDAQAITASAASTNYYDRGAKGTPYGAYSALVGDMGKGSIVPIRIQVVTTFATLTSLKVALQADDDVAFGTPTTVLETEAIAAAALVAGYYFNLTQIPMKTTERYLRLYYTVAGSDATAGKITAGHVLAHQTA